MKQSIGYTATLNIVIVFIVVVFAFILAALNYYKAFKVSNSITSEIEAYEGYNSITEAKVLQRLSGIGYNTNKINCSETVDECNLINGKSGNALVDGVSHTTGDKGYCVYYCQTKQDYYYYKIKTNMFMSVPIINNVLPIGVYTNSNELYDFETKFQNKTGMSTGSNSETVAE